MDNSDNKNQQRYIFSILSKIKASGGDGTTPDFSQARIEFVESLPTASANTLGVIYVIPNQDGVSGSIHFTKYDGQSYSWVAAGEKGEAGATPNISIGTVTSGEQASATIGGTPANPVLNLVLPQGPQGPQGNTGSSVDYPYELVNNRTTDDATKGLSAAEGKRLGDDISQLRQEVTADVSQLEAEVTVSATEDKHPTILSGLKLRTGGVTEESSTYKLAYLPVTANATVVVKFPNSTGTIRFAYSTSIPSAGTSVTGYITVNATDGQKTLTPSANCYLLVANDTGFGTGDPLVSIPKDGGVGYDVYFLKLRVNELEEITNETCISDVSFNVGSQIADGSDSRYPAGTVIANVSTSECSDLIPVENIGRIKYSLIARTANTAYAIAFYDSTKTFISGIKSDSGNEVDMDVSSFPANTAYLRFGSALNDGGIVPYATIYTNKDLFVTQNELLSFKHETDNGILAPLPVYWAVCGDSIAHANHTAMTELAADDIYRPIDDYTDKPGYSNARTGAYPNYAYHFCKRHRMQWANYGYGGTILGEYIPKYLGEDNLLYPFVGTRITQFKEGIPWNYISIMFGWNDNIHGPVYQKDKWLSETYGGNIGYPYTDDLIGADGFATQEQKDACDALGETYFFDAFIGSINDTGKDTWYGAWNYALGYLMREYPDAKIMIMCPFIGGTDRTNSQKFRSSVKAVAEKFGVACFDFNDLEWWYFTTIMNSTPFANPDRQDGRWVKMNGETTPSTIDGFNRARFCADSVHPTPLGYRWIADPIGYTLLQK